LSLILLFFFAWMGKFGPSGAQSTFSWLESTWTKENNYEHGWLVVVLAGWLFWRARPGFLSEKIEPAPLGLAFVVFGVLLFVMGWRPFFWYGAVVFLYGWRRARHVIFPLSMMAFVITVPGFQQMTTGLQIIATKMAYYATNFLGMKTALAGNRVYDPTGNWGNWEIDEGCSGIRSVVALTLVTYVYGMIAHRKWSERLVIFAACIPIAILANAVRVTSILIVARIDKEFAQKTWHDYSGFMSFGAALSLLLVLSTVMRHGVKALRPKVKVTKVGAANPPS
jgi:exosortase